MNIYIPSYNRHQFLEKRAQAFWVWPKDFPVYVVVRPKEEPFYLRLMDQLGLTAAEVLPIGKEGVCKTRNAILNHAGEGHIAILDDDINFLIRRHDHAYHLRAQTDKEVKRMFHLIDCLLNDFAQVGVSCREGNNRVEKDSVLNTRAIRLVGFDVDVLNKEKIRYRLDNREDFDITLRLLSLGFDNYVFYRYAQGQKSSGAKGGLCGSPVREPGAMAENAHRLAKLHPGLVKVVQKKTKTSFGGGTRTDVICYWKKAYAQSRNKTSKASS